MSKTKQLLVDVHTHCYLPRYSAFLRQRKSVPRIFKSGDEERLLILDDEPATGRPVGPQASSAFSALISVLTHRSSIGTGMQSSHSWFVERSKAVAFPTHRTLRTLMGLIFQ